MVSTPSAFSFHAATKAQGVAARGPSPLSTMTDSYAMSEGKKEGWRERERERGDV
jgi:hypothetical protein